MKKDKLKAIDIRLFLFPFLALAMLFAVITGISVNKHIKNTYAMIEKHSMGIVENYSKRIVNSNAATDIITNLIDEKLLSATKIINQLESPKKTVNLTELSEELFVDEINIYNEFGEIINSTSEQIIGWKAYEGHPAHNFMISGQETLIEDIRANSETKVFYKYAFARAKDNTIVQIGVLARKVYDFLHMFAFGTLIEDFVIDENVDNIFFTNADHEIIAGSSEEYVGMAFASEDIFKHFTYEKPRVGKDFAVGDSTLHVCAPVFYNGEKIGTLTVIWSPRLINTEIKQIIIENGFRLILVFIVLGAVLYYAYSKNKDNIKIAFYDELTGLPNNEYLNDYLSQKIKDIKNNKTAVLLLDCTNFKLLNLTYGFKYGNIILKQMAKVFADNIPAGDILFRFEADRFVAVIDDYKSLSELNFISQKLFKEFKSSDFNMSKHEYLTLKIALYEMQDQNISPSQILHNVFICMTSLKNSLSENYIVYNQEIKDTLLREKVIEEALMGVISGENEDALYMVYQPLFDIKTDKIVGFEALARLTVPNIGNISPLEFIALAEKRNLIFSLGNIILKRVLSFLKLLEETGYLGIYITVNISVTQLLRDDFVHAIKKSIGFSHKNLNRIVFEITESRLVENFQLVNERLAELKNMGSLVALDDFGTGYSSLAELRNLNIDLLKIEQSFIDKINQYDRYPLIVSDIISASHRLGLKTVAEGIESECQLNYLKEHGCDIAQGFYLSKPLSEARAIGFLKSYSGQRRQ
ncbi:MAG: bifunctional diguanylate cyclase/phosphodiesterase [Firmicutes bacterium]|nr:bifunctional diguanylate cyclase/phosphodiesterase [Bacillota bacterium]